MRGDFHSCLCLQKETLEGLSRNVVIVVPCEFFVCVCIRERCFYSVSYTFFNSINVLLRKILFLKNIKITSPPLFSFAISHRTDHHMSNMF